MASVNKVMLLGHLGKDPELRYTASGTPVASFSIATSESYKDKSGEKQEKTEWHNIVIWGKLAEVAGQYLAKGKPVFIEGKLSTRKWQDKDGKDRYTTEIVGERMQLLASKEGNRPPKHDDQDAPPSYQNYEEPQFVPDDEIPF